jgi:hypothetical protein
MAKPITGTKLIAAIVKTIVSKICILDIVRLRDFTIQNV